MQERRNHYRVLHLQPDAPIELVRVHYLTLMKRLRSHPDLGGEHWSAVHLNAAYSTLSKPERRAAYDRDLLARHDVETLSLGRFRPRIDPQLAKSLSTTNRRNYFRVLQVQREAPLEILEASHAALRAEGSRDVAVLDEAFEILKDPDTRRTYDRLLTIHGHQDALLHLRLELSGSSQYVPLITSYCAFCKTPHSARCEGAGPSACEECESPLFPPPESLLALARRAVSRAERDEPVTLYLGWPEPVAQGRILDLSPTGMKCRSDAPIAPRDILKVASRHFDAVGSVAHVDAQGPAVGMGLQFLSVCFKEARGNFMSLKA